ncbi:MAG: hypothetical protein CMA41_00840 [Euryarchaeota archaeon]|jgi:hypothetical protein|nr:hypothetical protein [Euryarchaeota archaeon]MBF14947.1 hypothetical protein [Euryarchaeota archaeon]|tara:strand:- start:152 stop:748 length:597 start_codon:yes stop_codon:yes gene_type:complete
MHQLVDVKVHQWGVEGLSMLHRDAIESWTGDKWGQPSVQIAEWLIEDDIVQAFIRLQRGALIIDASVDENGHLRCKNHLHIPFEQWNPGSIQANRTRDSRVRFRHRHAEIVLSARFRAPEWGQALLEEWLMAQRGEETRPKSSEQRLATIRRSKASIERYLEQSNLEYATEMLAITQISLDNAARKLAHNRVVAESEE